jgi:galactose oxidase
MGVLLQGFYKKKPNNAVPSPADGDASTPWWWDHLAAQANEFRQVGFTAVWLPPVLKTASGASPGADGYGAFDDYDIGSRHQKGTTPTRFGTRAQLQRCVATFRANGVDVYLDVVEHQRVGDTTPFVFRYSGADGTADAGRFPKSPSNFVPQVPRDPDLGGPVADDFPFGRELAPINALPHDYVFNNLIAAGDWLTRGLDAQGYRIDDVKGLSTDFLRPFLETKAMAGKFAVGEFFDGNPALVNGWIFNPRGMNGRASAFDFPLKFQLTQMCNNAGRFDMSSLDHAGLAGTSPLSAVTFVENHDTDLTSGESVVFNKILGYAYILTSEGYPCVYYRDYDTGPDGYKLKPGIDNLIWIHEKLAAGPTQQRWKDFDVFAYERLGGPHLLVGLNNDPGGPRTITVATGFGSHVGLHDYAGHAGNATTDGNGNVTITIPRNDNGLGYVCYSVDGQGGGFAITPQLVTQDFEGAADLDILPALSGKPVQAGVIWCAAHFPVRAQLKPVTTAWSNATAILLELLAPDGSVLAQQSFTLQTAPGAVLQATTRAEGFHTLRLTASNTPAANANPAYTLSVTYTAPSIFNQQIASQVSLKTQTTVAAAAPDPAIVGEWSPKFSLKNVAIHSHLLPTGKVLYWGRRKEPGSQQFDTLNEHATLSYVWDPATNTSTQTKNQPTLADGKTTVNLFCSGHTFLADGRLMVVGGHLFDSQGVNQSCIYDSATDQWTAAALMNEGRWYPSAVTLPDGGVMVLSGSFATGPLQPPNNDSGINPTPQIWRGAGWESMTDFDTLTLFPRFHVAPDGRVFMSGGLGESFFFDTSGGGNWIPGPTRQAGLRDYAPSVMYDTGKVAFIGGGLDNGTQAPTNIVEIIDLNAPAPAWQMTGSMQFARRQHNATILADGSVLATGGTRGNGFNDLDPGEPVHIAEIWNPATGKWSTMAAEDVDRCYHSTAVLLPDGRVLSAGGGEYAPTNNVANPAKDSHTDAQLFSPPYLFAGPRPTIAGAPSEVSYAQAFDVQSPEADKIVKVNWIRLASGTHSFDQNQRLNSLTFVAGAGKLTVTTPQNANICPPGHYMLFVISDKGVPSVAPIVRISAPQVGAPLAAKALFNVIKAGPVEKDAEIVKNAKRPPVTVGITPVCPYGISTCWGGARDALLRLSGVETVRHLANSYDSTADLYLKDDTLPDLDLWRKEFAETANASYVLRGIEMTLEGSVRERGGQLTLVVKGEKTAVLLAPLNAGDKVQWNIATHQNWPMLPAEQNAYQDLKQTMRTGPPPRTVTVTGPLVKYPNGFVLEVRRFAV